MSKRSRILFIFCFLVIASIVRYGILFFKEDSDYYDAIASNNIYYLQQFKNKYPNNEHITEINEKIEELRIIEIFRNNFLSNGSQPWSAALGTNYKQRSDRCKITINANDNSDVIAYARRLSDNDIKGHVYIRKNQSASFYLPEGTYKMLFYYGNGWNPNKIKKGKALELTGGFVLDEDNSDMKPEFFERGYDYEITLKLQRNGNLHLNKINEYEAF